MPTDLVQCMRIDPADLPSDAVIFGGTAPMREIQDQIERIVRSDLPVLIRGEIGTGKELIAKLLHVRSHRRDAPFVKVNCSVVPVHQLEAELLGYGNAFLAGPESRHGLFEMAAGGTLFLDEIDHIDRSLQTRLLLLLHDGFSSRTGPGSIQSARIRVICATTSDLEKAVERRAFRQDLFYRLEVIHLDLRPLRERRADIPQLCEYFLDKLAARFNKQTPTLSSGTMHILEQRAWPGNLRELENWIARVVILGEPRALAGESSHQPAPVHRENVVPFRSPQSREASRRKRPAVTRAVVLRALEANRWNRRKTAADLKMTYRSLLCRLCEAGVKVRRRTHRSQPPLE